MADEAEGLGRLRDPLLDGNLSQAAIGGASSAGRLATPRLPLAATADAAFVRTRSDAPHFGSRNQSLHGSQSASRHGSPNPSIHGSLNPSCSPQQSPDGTPHGDLAMFGFDSMIAEALDEVDKVHCADCQEEWSCPGPRNCPHCFGRVAKGRLPEGQSLRKLLDEVLLRLNGRGDAVLQELKQEWLSKITSCVQDFSDHVLRAHASRIERKAYALMRRVRCSEDDSPGARGIEEGLDPGTSSSNSPAVTEERSPESRAASEAAEQGAVEDGRAWWASIKSQLCQIQQSFAPYLPCWTTETLEASETDFVHCAACQLEWNFSDLADNLCTRCSRRVKDGHLPKVIDLRRDLIAEVHTLKALLFAAESGTLSVTWKGRLPKVSWANLSYALQTYSLMMAMVMCVGLFLGCVMWIFLFVMSNVDDDAPSRRGQQRLEATGFVVLFPILIFAGSLCIFNCVYLLTGQAAGVSFARCRALMLVAILKSQAFKVTWSTLPVDAKLEICRYACRSVDMWFASLYFSALVVVSFAAALWTLVSSIGSVTYVYALFAKLGTNVWGVAMLWTFMWGFLTIIVYILCDVWCSNNEELRNAVNAVQMALQKYDIRPGEMEQKSRVIFKWMIHDSVLTLQRDSLAFKRSATAFKQKVLPFVSGIVLILVALLTATHWLTVFGNQTNIVKMFLVSLWIMLSIFCIARMSSRAFPMMLSPVFFISIVLLTGFINGFLYCGLNLNPLFHGRSIPVPLSNHTPDAWVYENFDMGTISKDGQHPPYPACFMRWGANEEIKILDLAMLCSYSYDPFNSSYEEGGEVWMNTAATFTGQGIKAEILKAQDYRKVGRVVVFRFTTEGSDKGTIVLVVKGSSEAFDFYADAGLWASIASFQVFMVLVPLLDQLPNQLFAGLLKFLPHTAMERHIFSNIHKLYAEYTRDPRYQRDTFLITGHSLGGGIATAAGGSLGIPAVSFSGPGSHFSRWRFGTSEERAYRSALTVKPEIDIVHKIDRHDEMGQYIECRDANGNHRDVATCHMIGTTICELWRSCGDCRGRDFRAMCQELWGDTSHDGRYLT